MSHIFDESTPSFTHEFLNKPLTHGLLIIAGSVFFLLTAFHGNIWFDESYSVGIASQSFSDIWTFGSCDVHPVLYYCALHVLYLIFEEGFGADITTLIAVYRIFTIGGAIALAVLGYTHIRKDFGIKVGFFFSFLVVSLPFIAFMAVEIRMYTWAMFFVMVCFIYALRIMKKSSGNYHVPLSWWIVFGVSSLASAYLHYFAAIAAFLVNGLVLVYLILCVKNKGKKSNKDIDKDTYSDTAIASGCIRKNISVYFVCACLQLALYAPWLVALVSQVAVVSGTYWATFSFPHTIVELLGYPYMPSAIMFALFGSYGTFIQVSVAVVLLLLLVVSFFIIGRIIRSTIFKKATKHVVWYGLVVYFGVLVIGCVASLFMGQLIVYYRYLSVALGPLLLSFSLVLAYVKPGILVKAFLTLTVLLAFINQALLIYDDYSFENQKPLDRLTAIVANCVANNEGNNSALTADDFSNDAYASDDLSIGAFADDHFSGEALDEEDSNGKSQNVLVLSSDIGFMGVTSDLYPNIKQTYLDWQPGNWGGAYRVYEPALISVKSWDEALDNYQGEFVVIGQTCDGSVPKDIADLASKDGIEQVSMETYYRPYERTFFSIAVMKR